MKYYKTQQEVVLKSDTMRSYPPGTIFTSTQLNGSVTTKFIVLRRCSKSGVISRFDEIKIEPDTLIQGL